MLQDFIQMAKEHSAREIQLCVYLRPWKCVHVFE